MVDPSAFCAALGRSRATGVALAVDVLADAAAPWPSVQHAAHQSVVPLAVVVMTGLVGRAIVLTRAWLRNGGTITIRLSNPPNRPDPGL